MEGASGRYLRQSGLGFFRSLSCYDLIEQKRKKKKSECFQPIIRNFDWYGSKFSLQRLHECYEMNILNQD